MSAIPVPPAPVVVRGLSRSFGTVRALDGVDLEVERGSLFALLGANGAGKSTSVRILTGLLAASSGDVRVLGLDPLRQGLELRRRIGVVPDFPVLFDVLTGRENLARIASIRGLDRDTRERRVADLAGPLGLTDRLDRAAGALSKGERRKTALAAAMLHAPPLLFLDEPFEGIDPVSTRAILDLIDALRARGVTIFLTSHILPLVESIATDVAVLRSGRVVCSGSVRDVIGSAANLEDAVLARLGRRRTIPALDWYRPA